MYMHCIVDPMAYVVCWLMSTSTSRVFIYNRKEQISVAILRVNFCEADPVLPQFRVTYNEAIRFKMNNIHL